MPEKKPDALRLDVESHVAVLTINRPAKLNALDDRAVKALRDICDRLERMDYLRTVILTGSGKKAFSAGGDIDAWGAEDAEDFGRFWVRNGHDTFDALARLRQPVIAVLNGHAFGGGLELAAVADLRIAEEHIRIGQPETGLGIIPGWSGTQRAVRRFGSQLVRRMALFGEVFSAAEALQLGLVDFVVPSGTGLEKAREIAESVSVRAPLATELTKMLINAAEGEERERVLEALAGNVAAHSAELKEGLAAYWEKRRPNFSPTPPKTKSSRRK